MSYIRPLLIGEDNPHSSDPRHALFPWPPGCAGWRLCYVILGLDQREYLRRFERVNLCASAWKISEARHSAQVHLLSRRPLIVLGARACLAFGLAYEPFTRVVNQQMYILPHPSGRCRAWNEVGSTTRARELLAEFLRPKVVAQ